MDEGAYPSKMILALALPLLYGATMGWIPPKEIHTEKEIHSPKDRTILSSTRDDVHGVNCVSLVRVYRPDTPLIDASLYPVSTTTVSVGAIGKMVYNNGVWHVFYVLEVHHSTLKIVDGNYDDGFVTVRVIDRYDARVVGYL